METGINLKQEELDSLESSGIDLVLRSRLLRRGVDLLKILRLIVKDGSKAVPILVDFVAILDRHGDDALLILKDIMDLMPPARRV